jgi:hypothetical protein
VSTEDEVINKAQQEEAEEAERLFESRVATISAPPEEMKAFTAGLRIGYKQGFASGYAQRVAEEATQIVEPSEILHTKLKLN